MVGLSTSASLAARSRSVGEGAALSNSAPTLDIGGDLALPGLVDGHMHLDKTLTGLPWMGHAAGPSRMSRIETDKTILPHLPLSTKERAGNLIRECVARGTTHLRTHVDIDLEAVSPSSMGCLPPANAIAIG
jgi:cytosine/adenosine deaminase-related metal-dependent hydrolase